MQIKCTVCDGIAELVEKVEEMTIRGERIAVKVQYFKCEKCGDEFYAPDIQKDPFDEAYRLYRTKHNMVQPEEIRDFRHHFHLTQKELSNLIGCGIATISRYERGSLQEEVHDNSLRFVLDPINLKSVVTQSKDIFTEKRKREILGIINKELPEGVTLKRFIVSNIENYEPYIESGYRKYTMDKFANVVKYFCKTGETTTKLCKLLFYADFKHFKEYTVSITGTRYAHIPFGPAPDNYDLLFAMLRRIGDIRSEEIHYPNYSGENILANTDPNLNLFSNKELKTIINVKDFFDNYDAKKISEFSHKEEGYQKTEMGDIISYEYADHLQI